MEIQKFSEKIENAQRSLQERPAVYEGLLSQAEVQWLLEEEKNCETVHKANGIINHKYPKQGLVERFVEKKFEPYLGAISRHGGSYFYTPTAFHAHTDTGKADEMRGQRHPYKNILIPLCSSSEEEPLYTVFFRQRNFGEASHFWNAKEFKEKTPLYNHKVTDYQGLEYYTASPFPREDHEKHLSHLPIESLYGLSISEIIQWNIGDVIVFDCSQVHASNNFEKYGTVKHGLSYFSSKELNP